MKPNKVDYFGRTIIDLSNDTVTDDVMFEGYTAHGADGSIKTGSFTIESEITEQDDLIEQIESTLANKVINAPQKSIHTISAIRFGRFTCEETSILYKDDGLNMATLDRFVSLIPGHTYTISLGEYVSTIKFNCILYSFPGAEDIDLSIPDRKLTYTTTTYTATGPIERIRDSGWIITQDGYTFTASEDTNLMTISFFGNSIGEWTNFSGGAYPGNICSNFSITEEWGIDGTDDFRRRLVEGKSTYFEIPEGTTSIRRGAFYECGNFLSVKIPESVMSIGSAAFFGCTSADFSPLPQNLQGELSDLTFFLCYKLKISEIPAGVTKLTGQTFGFCSALTSITFKGTPETISNNVFYNCTNLTTINVPWSEGAVANAPWGATNATINYNYLSEPDPYL